MNTLDTVRRALLWTPGILILLAGCGSRDYQGAQRFPLSGTVTCDGELIDSGSIAFIPTSGDARVSGGPIEDGAYSVPESNGANEGNYRVEVHWWKKTGKRIINHDQEEVDERKEGLPARYHTESELTAQVSEGKTTFDFDLTSK